MSSTRIEDGAAPVTDTDVHPTRGDVETPVDVHARHGLVGECDGLSLRVGLRLGVVDGHPLLAVLAHLDAVEAHRASCAVGAVGNKTSMGAPKNAANLRAWERLMSW